MRRTALLITTVLLAAASAAAEPLEGACPLTAEQTNRAIAAFAALKPVLQHPRCMNCHGLFADLKTNPATKHPGKQVGPEDECKQCHEQAGDVWEIPPPEMFFNDRSDSQLCMQFKLKRSGARLMNHVTTDKRILLGFEGRRGQDLEPKPPPVSHDEFVKMVAKWVAAIYGSDKQEAWEEEFPGGSDTKCGCEPIAGTTTATYDQRAVATIIHAADSTARIGPEQVTQEIASEYMQANTSAAGTAPGSIPQPPDESDEKTYRLSFGMESQSGDERGVYEITKGQRVSAPPGFAKERVDPNTGVTTWSQTDLGKYEEGVLKPVDGLIEACAEKRFKGEQTSVCRRKPFQEGGTTFADAKAAVMRDVEERTRTLIETGRRYGLFGEEASAISVTDCTPVGVPPTDIAGASEMGKELHRRVRAWRSGQDPDHPGQGFSIDALTMEQLQQMVPIAQEAGKATGMDSSRLQTLNNRLTEIWEVTKKSIRGSEFKVPENVDPSRRDIYGPKPKDELPEEETAKRQEYRVRLYKRITLAYLDALLSAQETIGQCCVPHEIPETIEFQGQTFPKLGCEDPVVKGLVEYGKAIQEIGSAEFEMLRADYEILLQQQQLTVDVLAVIPLVGDALDAHSLWTEEDLTGNCLTRFEKAFIPLMHAIPIIGPAVFKQVVKRSPRAAAAVERIGIWFAAAEKRFQNATAAIAHRWNRTPAEVAAIKDAIKEANPLPNPIARDLEAMKKNIASFTDDEIRAINPERLSDPSKIDVKKARAKMEADAIIDDNLRMASEDRIWIKRMSPELQRDAAARSEQILKENLEKLQPDRDAVVSASNLVKAHLDEIESAVVKKPGEPKIIIFRYVEPDATVLIEQHFATKGMSVKGKSSNWGPQAGFICVDQQFSKIGNPKHPVDLHALEKLKKFQGEVDKCLQAGICFKTNAVRDGRKIMLVPDASGREIPVWQGPDGSFIHPETNQVIPDVDPRKARPMEILCDDQMRPLTADYDFLAFGLEGEHSRPNFNPNTGFITQQQEEILKEVNDAVKKAGYQGGNISHHGAETFYPGSPGALKVDPVMTAIDPKRGLVTIPRCNEECMALWCKNTGACGGLPICGPNPHPPCIPVDPDRLLKDYFHAARLDGFNLDPNPAWNWGSYNVMGGWTVRAWLEEGVVGQAKMGRVPQETVSIAEAARRVILNGLPEGAGAEILQAGRRAIISAAKGLHWAFSCSPRADGTIPEKRE